MAATISESTLRRAFNLFKEAGKPGRIILFGSYGRGSLQEDSDLDFLIVQPVAKDRRQEMVRLRRVLSPLLIPADVLAVSERTFQDWADTPGNILDEAWVEQKLGLLP